MVHITTVPEMLGFLRGQLSAMNERGFDAAVVSSPGRRLTVFGDVENVPVAGVAMTRSITPLRDCQSLALLCRALRSMNPVILHAHTPKGGLLGMIAAVITRVPIRIYHIHGFPYMAARGKRRALLKSTERISCLLAHRVFCVSHSIGEVAIADGICSADKIVVFAGGSINGIDAEETFNPDRFSERDRRAVRERLGVASNELVIGFVGRLVRDKGMEELAEAWTMLRDQFEPLRLVLVGPEEPQDPVSESTMNLFRKDPRVILTGSVDDISAYYSIFDLVALPTYREGLPYVPLEAAAMEVPVVATRIPGCVDAIQDGVTGTLVPVRNVDALEQAIRMYLDDPALRKRHGMAGRERVLREFRQEVIWEAVYQEYCRLLRNKEYPVPQPSDVPAA